MSIISWAELHSSEGPTNQPLCPPRPSSVRSPYSRAPGGRAFICSARPRKGRSGRAPRPARQHAPRRRHRVGCYWGGRSEYCGVLLKPGGVYACVRAVHGIHRLGGRAGKEWAGNDDSHAGRPSARLGETVHTTVKGER